jgi:hypothetical protein
MSQLPAYAAASPPGSNPILTLLATALADLPRRDRNALLSFLDFWRDLPGEERALFAKSVRPGLTDEEVARLCGVSRRTLYRWDRFRRFKTWLADFGGPTRRAGHSPDDAEA